MGIIIRVGIFIWVGIFIRVGIIIIPGGNLYPGGKASRANLEPCPSGFVVIVAMKMMVMTIVKVMILVMVMTNITSKIITLHEFTPYSKVAAHLLAGTAVLLLLFFIIVLLFVIVFFIVANRLLPICWLVLLWRGNGLRLVCDGPRRLPLRP